MGGDWYYPDNNFYYDGAYWSDWFGGWDSLPPAIQAFLIGGIVIVGLILLASITMLIIGMAKTFKKAGQPAWAAIVPFYDLYIMVKISGLEFLWFIIASLVLCQSWWHFSLASILVYGAMNYKIAQSFGKKIGFAIGMTILPPIFWLILGCSTDKYLGPAGPYKIKYAEAPKKAKQ